MVEERVFHIEDRSLVENSEEIKMKSFYLESAENVGEKDEGYYVYIKSGDKSFFEETEDLKREGIKEVKGEDKNKIMKKIKEIHEDQVASGFGLF